MMNRFRWEEDPAAIRLEFMNSTIRRNSRQDDEKHFGHIIYARRSPETRRLIRETSRQRQLVSLLEATHITDQRGSSLAPTAREGVRSTPTKRPDKGAKGRLTEVSLP